MTAGPQGDREMLSPEEMRRGASPPERFSEGHYERSYDCFMGKGVI